VNARASVVLINGLWLGNAALVPLALRLRRAGFRVYPFSYPSVRNDLRANTGRLQAFLDGVPGETVHFVAYSLGGLVLRALFHFHPVQRPGRIVLLASPQQGIRSATGLAASRLGRSLLGKSVLDLVAGRARDWGWPAREIGVIAGRRPFGLGRLLGRLPAPNDGTVLVAETEVSTARDQRIVNVPHSGMLLSGAVAAEVVAFLDTGAFRAP
jgi:pimeloyl-ACP methyl ester carboxylesterase